jgi:cyanophycinase-like exopeptidase
MSGLKYMRAGTPTTSGGNMSTVEATDLKADDRERMQRLTEEVRGRLTEMALITTRTLGIGMDEDSVVKFAPVEAENGTGKGIALQVLERSSGPNCVCYIDPPGVCQPCQVDPIKILP